MPADGLLVHVDEALDPGVKTLARVEEKAMFKYRDQHGHPRFDRVQDIARMALQFDSVKALNEAIPRIYEAFEVVEVENRFANPTALGWMDITFLIRLQLDSGAVHIAEMQAQLTEFSLERRLAHKHYKSIRAAIPAMGVRAEHVDAVQRLILDAIEGPAQSTSGRTRTNSLVDDSSRCASLRGMTQVTACDNSQDVCAELGGGAAVSRDEAQALAAIGEMQMSGDRGDKRRAPVACDPSDRIKAGEATSVATPLATVIGVASATPPEHSWSAVLPGQICP